MDGFGRRTPDLRYNAGRRQHAFAAFKKLFCDYDEPLLTKAFERWGWSRGLARYAIGFVAEYDHLSGEVELVGGALA